MIECCKHSAVLSGIIRACQCGLLLGLFWLLLSELSFPALTLFLPSVRMIDSCLPRGLEGDVISHRDGWGRHDESGGVASGTAQAGMVSGELKLSQQAGRVTDTLDFEVTCGAGRIELFNFGNRPDENTFGKQCTGSSFSVWPTKR